MQLTARLVQLLPLQSGTGKNGQWKKQDIIVETEATYPKKVCISVWGDKIETAGVPAATSPEKVMSNFGPENINNDDDLPF